MLEEAWAVQKGTFSWFLQEQKFEHFSPVTDNNEKADSFKSVSLETVAPEIANNSEGDYHISRQNDLYNHTTSTEDVEHNDEDADVDNCLQAQPGKSDASVHSATGLSNEEDISFCDLEDEDDTLVKTDSTNNRFTSIQVPLS